MVSLVKSIERRGVGKGVEEETVYKMITEGTEQDWWCLFSICLLYVFGLCLLFWTFSQCFPLCTLLVSLLFFFLDRRLRIFLMVCRYTSPPFVAGGMPPFFPSDHESIY